MSCYLGFQPSDSTKYFFISYNSEDYNRIGPIAKKLSECEISLWYDYGLEYGEKWEKQIAGKIKDATAIILFFTKGILLKENSYVRKEYLMATKFFGKKVYVVMLDKVAKTEIPDDKVTWWIDIQEKQTINVMGVDDKDVIVNNLLRAMGINNAIKNRTRILNTIVTTKQDSLENSKQNISYKDSFRFSKNQFGVKESFFSQSKQKRAMARVFRQLKIYVMGRIISLNSISCKRRFSLWVR